MQFTKRKTEIYLKYITYFSPLESLNSFYFSMAKRYFYGLLLYHIFVQSHYDSIIRILELIEKELMDDNLKNRITFWIKCSIWKKMKMIFLFFRKKWCSFIFGPVDRYILKFIVDIRAETYWKTELVIMISIYQPAFQ